VIKSRIRWIGQGNAQKMLFRKSQRKRPLKETNTWENNIKVVSKEMGHEGVN
jgi:hypothetical protein